MNEICINIITRAQLKGHQNLAAVLTACAVERQSLKLDSYAFCEPINNSFSAERIPDIVRRDAYSLLLRDSKRATTASVWMNNRIGAIFLESKNWNAQLAADLWALTLAISQVIALDFAFMDVLSPQLVEAGQKIGAVLKTQRHKDAYSYSLFPKSLAMGLPDAYHYMLIDQGLLCDGDALASQLQQFCTVSQSGHYLQCVLPEALGSAAEALVQKKGRIFELMAPQFSASVWA